MLHFIFIGCFLFLLNATTVSAGEIPMLSVQHPPHLKPVNDWNIEILSPTTQHPLTFQGRPLPATDSYWVRIDYTSNHPAAVLIATKTEGFWEYSTLGYVWAELPVSNGKEKSVGIPLDGSPLWNGSVQRRTMTVYGLQGQHPTVHRIRGMGHRQFFDRTSVYLGHVLKLENYDSHAMHYLRGYRVKGIPLSGVLFVIVVLIGFVVSYKVQVASLQKNYGRIMCCIALAVLFLYQTRSMVDLVRASVRDVAEWSTHQTYGEFGEAYQLVNAYHELVPATADTTVAVCGQLTTPMIYFLHPANVGPHTELWDTATHAVLFDIWSEQNGTITCGGKSRSGRILKALSNQTALVEFTQP